MEHHPEKIGEFWVRKKFFRDPWGEEVVNFSWDYLIPIDERTGQNWIEGDIGLYLGKYRFLVLKDPLIRQIKHPNRTNELDLAKDWDLFFAPLEVQP